MVKYISALILASLLIPPAMAQSGDGAQAEEQAARDPEAMVTALYADIIDRGALPMTQRLETLFLLERDYLEASGYPVGRLDFDWTVNGQDALITDLAFETVDVPIRDYGDAAVDQFDRKIIIASFKNFASPTEIRYYWIRERSGWKLDDVTGDSEDGMTWTLSLLLAYGG
tara:strand:- start:338 stop:850 length:513 start_codon:yes stop_codon:yes gene_type:complete